ncbi:MAG: diguanylate cyclase [Marinobacter sp.]|uniref:diguanylate cyclase n=1 Tax=Marinobacter sp. TaxID=50741 RepID=UPI00396D530D
MGISQLTNQQLQLVVTQLDRAIQSHDQWYKNFLRVLIARLSPDEADMLPDAHRRCDFGQWYEGPQAASLQENPSFALLGDAHETMHNEARTLLQRISENLPISVSEWDHFDNSLGRMRLEFKALRDAFAGMAQNQDPLTDTLTRASLLHDLREQHALVERGRQTCTIALFDLDHFKRINDEYGHAAGDKVLVSTIHHVKSHLRRFDRVYRYGGEEFIICMPGTNIDQGCHVVERVRAAIAEQRFQFDKARGGQQMTASFGITVLTPFQTVEESIDRADKAMYEAKATGRNRVVVHV